MAGTQMDLAGLGRALTGWSTGIGTDVLQAAAMRGVRPLVAAIDDAAPTSIPDQDIVTAVVSADVNRVEVHVTVTGSDTVLDEDARAAIGRAIDAEAEGAIAEIVAEVSNALDRLETA